MTREEETKMSSKLNITSKKKVGLHTFFKKKKQKKESTQKYSRKASTQLHVLKYLVLTSMYSKYSSTRYLFSKFTKSNRALDTCFQNLLKVLKYSSKTRVPRYLSTGTRVPGYFEYISIISTKNCIF